MRGRLRRARRPGVDGGAGRLGDQLATICQASSEDLDLLGSTVCLMSRPESSAVAAASAPLARELDELQFGLGEGPTRDAFRLGRAVQVPDLDRDRRWPGFAPAAVARGLGAAWAFPLGAGSGGFGTMTHYSGPARTLLADEVDRCVIYADVATELLLDSAAEEEVEGADGIHGADGVERTALEDVLDLRIEVFQAQGMVMVDLGVGLDEAMAYLRARAFADDVTLNDLAVGVVAGRVAVLPLGDPGTMEPPVPDLES